MGQETKSSSLYWDLFYTFVKIGAFTLGGGYAMLAMVEKAVVEQRKWIEEKDFWDMITLVQTLPGVFAINTALYVGYRIKGMKAAIAAMLGAALPSFIIIILLATFFSNMWENEVVVAIFKGIRPCVVALILAPSIKMVKSVGISLKMMWVPILAVIAVCVFYISPIYVIVVSALGGLLWGMIKMDKKGGEKC
ncbi:MAG: chromate transporter [Paludibacteraceae bacterium]|nr:chromate transporter [Paludibacteraceae bacterium]